MLAGEWKAQLDAQKTEANQPTDGTTVESGIPVPQVTTLVLDPDQFGIPDAELPDGLSETDAEAIENWLTEQSRSTVEIYRKFGLGTPSTQYAKDFEDVRATRAFIKAEAFERVSSRSSAALLKIFETEQFPLKNGDRFMVDTLASHNEDGEEVTTFHFTRVTKSASPNGKAATTRSRSGGKTPAADERFGQPYSSSVLLGSMIAKRNAGAILFMSVYFFIQVSLRCQIDTI